uniref:Ig-like domain-containing protein n=1 Tax=Myripristis murdjan TaxID=586833 RepID=A0A667YMB8_9TELE
MGSRIQVLDNGTLIVHSINDKDAGDYLCVARSKIGDDLQLMKVSVSMKPRYLMHDTTLHDRGNYVCRAQNDVGEAVLSVPVIIIAYPPRITSGPPPNVRAVAGAPIQLNCAAIGIPKPEITWELPDHSILSTAGQGRPTGSELLHPQGTLIIQRPTSSDSGTYKCLAKNHLGTDSKGTFVHVEKNFPFNHFPNADVVMTVICVIKYFKNTSSALKVKIGLLKNIYTEACFTLDRHLHEQ